MRQTTTTDAGKTAFGWAWIGRCLKVRRRQVILLLSLTGGIYLVSLVFPISAQIAIDRIVNHRASLYTIGLVALVAASSFLEAALLRRRQAFVIDLAMFIDRRIAQLAFSHLLRTRAEQASLQAGDTINRFTESRKIQNFLFNDVPQLAFEIGGMAIAAALIFYYDWLVGIASIGLLPLIVLAVRKPLSEIPAASAACFSEMGTQYNVLSETVGGLATVKSTAQESVRFNMWLKATDALLQSVRKSIEVRGMYFVRTQIAIRLFNLAIISIGCFRMAAGELSIGQLISIQILIARLTTPILQSTDVFGRFHEVDLAVGKLREFLSHEKDTASVRPALRRFTGSGIDIKKVSVTYAGRSQPALRDIDLRLPERGVVAIVGKNGSGKSTLVKTLTAILRDYEGEVIFRGNELRRYNSRWLRSKMGVVDQDTVLFGGSIRFNLVGDQRIDDRAIWSALEFSGADGFIRALPDGLDTILYENGRGLSGGQRQRLAVSRAVLHDPSLAVFDEPTSALDAEGAVALERRITEWGYGRLILLVSHHLHATRRADRIVVLQGGTIVGDDTHDELLISSQPYKAMWSDYVREETALS